MVGSTADGDALFSLRKHHQLRLVCGAKELGRRGSAGEAQAGNARSLSAPPPDMGGDLARHFDPQRLDLFPGFRACNHFHFHLDLQMLSNFSLPPNETLVRKK